MGFDNNFLDILASSSPTPGGGSASALAGALAAGLTSMVCNLTIGKKKYEEVSEELTRVLQSSEELRQRLTKLVEEDSEAFNRVMAAFRLPKETQEEKETRSRQIEEATKGAAKVPLEVMEEALRVLDLSQVVAEKGNPNSISDAGVAALLAWSAVEGADLNVEINLSSLKDESFVKGTRVRCEDIKGKAQVLLNGVLTLVRSKL